MASTTTGLTFSAGLLPAQKTTNLSFPYFLAKAYAI
jgi:hypothetical protein